MYRRPVIFREAPRFLAVRQEEWRKGIRPIRRIALTYGPVLSLLGLWFIHRFAAVALTPSLAIGLFLAPLGIVLPFELPALLSHIPAMSPHFLKTWRLTRHGVLQQSGYGTSGFAWSMIESLAIEESPDEITLHLDARVQSTVRRTSLTCLRKNIMSESLALFVNAVREKTLAGEPKGPGREM